MSDKPVKTYEGGIRFACAIVDETYAKSSTHPYMLGDCILAKLNMLPKSKIRRNLNMQDPRTRRPMCMDIECFDDTPHYAH